MLYNYVKDSLLCVIIIAVIIEEELYSLQLLSSYS